MATDKNKALGMNVSTASAQLKKNLLFKFMRVLELDKCFQCKDKIESVDKMSVEHKTPWLSASDPKASFFDLNNIAFSHLSCNCAAGLKVNTGTHKDSCPQGHPYDEVNTRIGKRGEQQCKLCDRDKHRKQRNP